MKQNMKVFFSIVNYYSSTEYPFTIENLKNQKVENLKKKMLSFQSKNLGKVLAAAKLNPQQQLFRPRCCHRNQGLLQLRVRVRLFPKFYKLQKTSKYTMILYKLEKSKK
jgi:hypothetical protein